MNLLGKDTTKETREVKDSVQCWNTTWIVLSSILISAFALLVGANLLQAHPDENRKTEHTILYFFMEVAAGSVAPVGLLVTSLKFNALMKEDLSQKTVSSFKCLLIARQVSFCLVDLAFIVGVPGLKY